MTGVSYIHKLFNRQYGLWVEETDCVLAGGDVIHHVTNDKAIFKQLKNGTVSIYRYLYI